MASEFDVVEGVRSGDNEVWRELVAVHGPRIWAVTRGHGLNDADAGDVFQTTWLNLAEHIDSIRDSGKIAAWLVTVARRECLRVIGLRRPIPVRWLPEEAESPEQTVLKDERDRLLWVAFRALPERCQRLLRLYAYAPEYTYRQLADAVGIAAGSVGQTKGRCLEALKLKLERRVFDRVDPMPRVLATPQQPRERFVEVEQPPSRSLWRSLSFRHGELTLRLELGHGLHGVLSQAADVRVWWPDGMLTADVDGYGLFSVGRVPAGPARLEVDGIVTDWFVQ